MGLFDNVGNLVDLLLQDDQRPETRTLANRAEVDTSDFSKIAVLGLPAILQGISRNTQDDVGLDSFNQALNRHQDVGNYQSVDQLTQAVDSQDGDKILGHVFNNKQSLFDRISNSAGVSNSSVQRVLTLLAPIVLKYLADRKNTHQLDKRGVRHETDNLLEQVNHSVREYGRSLTQQDKTGGFLDGILNRDGKSNDTRPLNDENDGLLDDLLDLFK